MNLPRPRPIKLDTKEEAASRKGFLLVALQELGG